MLLSLYPNFVDMDIDLFSNNVRQLCQAKEMTLNALADKMGVNPASVSRALKGNPQLDTIIKIAEALNVPVRDLFEERGNIEGYALVNGKPIRFNSIKELESALNQKKMKIGLYKKI